MDGFSSFAEIAPLLHHPLVLVGFALFLFLSVFSKRLFRPEFLPKVSQRKSGELFSKALVYAFVLVLTLIILGFSYVIMTVVMPAQGEVSLPNLLFAAAVVALPAFFLTG